MAAAEKSDNADQRRIFLGAGLEYFQIFSIAQNAADSSLYFHAPRFEEIEWRLAAMGADFNPVLLSYQVAAPGKLSLHSSGLVHAKPFGLAGSNEFAIRGSILKSSDGKVLSVRHLLTIFLSEPRHKPNSPAGARKTDELLTTKTWHPYVLVFWAVPLMRSKFSFHISGSWNTEELEEVPPNGGWGAFNMVTHAVVWFAYRTKHMSRWPKNSQASYSDGYAVPIFTGTGDAQFRLDYRQPKYSLVSDRVSIEL